MYFWGRLSWISNGPHLHELKPGDASRVSLSRCCISLKAWAVDNSTLFWRKRRREGGRKGRREEGRGKGWCWWVHAVCPWTPGPQCANSHKVLICHLDWVSACPQCETLVVSFMVLMSSHVVVNKIRFRSSDHFFLSLCLVSNTSAFLLEFVLVSHWLNPANTVMTQF